METFAKTNHLMEVPGGSRNQRYRVVFGHPSEKGKIIDIKEICLEN